MASVSLQDLIRRAGVVSDIRQPCLPAPQETAVVASEDDHNQARNILQDRRAKNPEHKDVLKRIFRGSKDKDKDKDAIQYSQEELDQALSAVLRGQQTNPGLTQAFIDLGAKVNFIETPEKKRRMSNQPNTGLRRRSTVLQQAATLRRPTCVSLLASSGADQTTLDESLKAALTSNDQSCIQELLRHGADINKVPSALGNAVRSNDQNYVKLLLRSPKPLKTDVISSALPAAVQQQSEQIASMLIAYGADPNFDSASAFQMAVGMQNYRLAIILVAGPIPLSQPNLQRVLDTTMRLPTVERQLQFLQLLLCCGLPPNSIGLADLLNCRSRQNDTEGMKMMLSYGVPTTANNAECLRLTVANANWDLVEAIAKTPITPEQATAALAVLPPKTSASDRFRAIQVLTKKGASGDPLSYWLTRAVEDGDTQLMKYLLSVGAPVDASSYGPFHVAIKRKDIASLRVLVNSQPTPEVLAKAFPLLRTNYSPSERFTTTQLLLSHGARGVDVDEALIYAVADTSQARDPMLISELVRGGANVNHNGGKAFQLATTQVDLAVLRLLCDAKPTPAAASSALAFAFDAEGRPHAHTAEIIQLLLAQGVEEQSARRALRIAISGGPDNLETVKLLIAADINLLSSAFEYTVAIEDPQKKAPILDTLLKLGVSQETLDTSLAAESHQVVITKDPTNAKLLLERGASVSHNKGEALSVVVALRDSSLTKLFLSGKHQPSRSSLTRAFRKLHTVEERSSTRHDAEDTLIITRELLLRGVEQPAIDAALRITLAGAQENQEIRALLDLLLDYNANVNTAEGVCLVFGCARQDRQIFKKLLQHRPDYKIIVPVLLKSTLPGDQVVQAIKMCWDHGLTADDLRSTASGSQPQSALVLAMDKYPRCEALTKLMLDIGCNPDVTVQATVHTRTGEEMVSALLWAINQAEKRISDSVILSLCGAGASIARASPVSEISPLAISAREGRGELVRTLLERGADASARDKWNRSALFYASSISNIATVQALAPRALKNDGSLHEAARCLHPDITATLIKFGHQPHFPSRVHQGRDALSELCLKGRITSPVHRSRVRQVIRLLLDNGADPKFRVRNEKSAIFTALDNPYSSLEITEALLETEVWEDLNDEKHLYRDTNGLWYSPIKYVELVPSPHRVAIQSALMELFSDKGCEPRYYSETAQQPPGAVGLPKPIRQLADRQKEHELTLKHEHERHEHARTRDETIHKDELRRKKEQQTADSAAQTAAQEHWQALEQQKHDFEVHRVRDAERMKRSEKVAWHNLIMEQERDASTRRQSIDDRKMANSLASEAKMIEQRKNELDHRAGVERRMLKDKEDVYERNVKRQTEVMKRADESAQLHARLRQERPAIEGAPQWGSVD